MKPLLLTLALLCLFPALQAQSYRPIAERQFKSLVGTIYLLPFFLDTEASRWTEEEVETCLTHLKSSEDWIMGQAAPYNVELKFSDDFVSSKDEEIMIDSTVRNRSSINLLKITMEQLGFDSYGTYLRFHGLDATKQKVYVVFFMKALRSISHEPNPTDCILIYYDASFSDKMCPTLIAHELLHFFGAWDLYHEEGRLSKELADKATRLYPKSIMKCRTCPYLEIDELTAWLIGWNQNYKEAFNEFSPQNYKRESKTRVQFDLKKKDRE